MAEEEIVIAGSTESRMVALDKNAVLELSKYDLEVFTDSFSDNNFISDAQYCKLYHGKIPDGWKGLEGREVTVKVWVDHMQCSEKQVCSLFYSSLVKNFNFELEFLQSMKATCCCYLPELIAHARDDDNTFLGVVYDFQSSNTLRNFVEQEEFKWLERIKVAVGLGHLLRFLIHEHPRYLVRDLNAGNIMLDKDWKPVLFNFFMLAGAPVERAKIHERIHYGCYGYIDMAHFFTGLYEEYSDVFAFGIILCELLFKRQVDRIFQHGAYNYIYNDARELYPLESSECSFVDQSFQKHRDFNADDGAKLSKLARLCVDEKPEVRPDMQEVVEMLGELHVVRDYAESRIRTFELFE